MQAEVAENVASTMSANIATYEINALQYQATKSEEAYRTYLKAEYQFNKLSGDGIKNAIELYKQAISIDSAFVEPYEGLATTYILSGAVWGILPQEEAWRMARPILEKALILDSLKTGRNRLHIEAQIFSGLFYYELDIQAAESYFSKAIRNNVDFTYMNFSFDYTRKTGRWLITKEITEKDFTRNLATGDAHMQLAIIYYKLGEKEKAMDLLKISDPIQQDDYFYLQETSKWYFYMGEIAKSRQHLERMLAQFEDRPPINYWLTAIHSKIALENDKLESSLNALRKQFADRNSGSPAWFLALYYFYIGDNNTGFEWLQKSYDRREVEMTWLKEEPMLQSLKGDPRYIELYNKMGFQYVNQELLK
jgi:tetratricopeptide (TPR) repeat protein